MAIAALSLIGAVKLPDIANGVLNGRVAVLVWPRFGTQLIEPVDCVAHLVRRDDSEALFPCGAWFQPSPGTYRLWLEQKDLISPMPDLLVYAGGPFKGRGLGDIVDVVLGGRVQLSPGIKMSEDNHLLLFHLDSHLRLGPMGRVFERNLSAAKARGPILMPAGRIIAAIIDRRGNALALSRPISVPERTTVIAVPRAPNQGSNVFIVLDRARTNSSRHPDDVTVALKTENRSFAPDVFVKAADRFYGVWYGISATRAVVEVSSTTMALPSEEISLRPGSITTLIRTLRVLPNLRVTVRTPAGSFEGLKKSIEVQGLSQQPLRHLELSATEARLESLPAEPLRVSLTIDKWRFVRKVDLSGFEDHDVLFDLQPIVVSGTVYRGQHRVAGTVKFYIGPEWAQTTADDLGQYQITLWEPRSYPVEIEVRADRAPPFREYFVELLHSQTRDFHIPDTHYAVRVTDADSGAPIAGAEVMALNKFLDGQGREQSAAQKTVTDREGNALLPAQRPGSVGVVARAKGYRESESAVIPVDEGAAASSTTIELHSEGDTEQLRLRLPNGGACAGAEVIAVPNDGNDTIIWQSSAAADGMLTIPKEIRGAVLVIKHPSTAAFARVWNESEPSATWDLPNAVGPLIVKVVDAAGEAVRFADVILWVNAIPLRGNALRFLTGSPPLTDRDGYWKAASLGGQGIEVLAMRRFRPPIVRALAERVNVPWPNPLMIHVVE